MNDISYKTHLEHAHRFGMIQNDVEVRAFLDWYGRLKPLRIMEIGTHTGGFLSLLIQVGLQPKQVVISVDLPWQEHEYAVGNFREVYADRVKFIVGNSHDVVTLHQVWAALRNPDSPKLSYAAFRHGTDLHLDFLFLDGDHSFEGAQEDFIKFSGLVRPGGWIGFHDINNGHGCGKFYWEQAINGRAHVEFGYGREFGIGCVQV